MRWILGLLAILVATTPMLASAEPEAPYKPGSTAPPPSRDEVACGFVETTWDDPDWVFACSDHILRSSVCLAPPECGGGGVEEYWFNRAFSPCYPTNRYWKFPENSGSGYAYPMSALGVGTFDGLFIRRNVKFRLYSGTGADVPFGPEMQGPKYISIDFWGQYFPECGEFEPGTFLVTGEPGALAYYSIRIELDTEIRELDLKQSDNTKDHHTDAFPAADYFVLRRSDTFKIFATMTKEYAPACHEIYLEAQDELEPGSDPIEIPASEDPVPPDEWGVRPISISANPDETRKVELEVTIPSDAAVGKYSFKVLVRETGQTDPLHEKDFGKPVVILFNPFSTHDAVYMAGEPERNEYVQSTTGRLWQDSNGTHVSMAWGFSQFTKNALEIAIEGMDALSATDRANPGLVARRFTAFANSNGGGILVGRWPSDGSYPGGHPPGYWSSSGQIIDQYVSSGSPVKYGQCWVFGGLLTTLLRTAGIPARPLTNYASGHDRGTLVSGSYQLPFDKNVDYYYNPDGTKNRVLTEGLWNYHVWCDAWLGAWNAVDATPQEMSGGEYQLGPAPVSAVHGNSGGAYDVDFVYGEVNGDRRYFWERADGSHVLLSTNTTLIGHDITTRAVGGGESDITALYKVPESPFRLREGELALAVEHDDTLPLGQDIELLVTSTNNGGQDREVWLVIEVRAISYNGDDVGLVAQADEEFLLAAGGQWNTPLVVDTQSYLAWMQVTRFFEVSAFLQDESDEETAIATVQLHVSGPALAVTLEPEESIFTGETATVSVSWVNPLAVSVEDVEVSISTSEGIEIEGGHVLTIPIGTVPPNGQIDVDRQIDGVAAGDQVVGAFLGSTSLSALGTAFLVVVEDCNGNGQEDPLDISSGVSQDCNNNEIPDECEPDCNESGVPDDCDLVEGTSEDCNGNSVPDECDLASGYSPDINSNGVPDECDPDCNNNDLPDDLDIASGYSSDYNGNGIPDECDEDCNGNGVPDEVDIALGTSLDENGNSVPDECESGAAVEFVRSDVDGSGFIDISDPIFNLAYQFAGGPAPSCLDVADDDNSGVIDISDPLYSLAYQFANGPPPVQPFPECGQDTGIDSLSCDSFDPCRGGVWFGRPADMAAGPDERFILVGSPDASVGMHQMEIILESVRPLSAFECTVEYEGAELVYEGLERSALGASLHFLSTRDDQQLGRIRLGGVVDFGLRDVLPAGRHSLGYLIFRNVSGDPSHLAERISSLVRVEGGKLVRSDLRNVVIGQQGTSSTGDGEAGSDSPRYSGRRLVGRPEVLTLLPPVPNPTNGTTVLQFGTPVMEVVQISIFDAAGRRIRTLVDGQSEAGWHSLVWDGADDGGRRVTPGVYFVRLQSAGQISGQSLIVIR